MKYLKVIVVCVALLIAVEGRAYAYTDPGSGTMLLQMLAAIIVGLLFYIRRIKLWVSSLFNKQKNRSQSEPQKAESREGATQPVEE
jgi:hypothetical protein